MSGAATDTRIQRIRANQGLLLRDLRLRSLAESPDAFGQPIDKAQDRPDVEWHRSARQSALGDSRIWLFAQRGHDVIGLIQGRKRPPATLLLFSMWVDPRARQRGLGRELVESLERWASGWDARETILWVYGDNDLAIRFYGNLGFEVVRNGEDAESGARFGALAMQRPLKTPPP